MEQTLTLEQRVQLLEKELLNTRRQRWLFEGEKNEEKWAFHEFLCYLSQNIKDTDLKLKESIDKLLDIVKPFREIQEWQKQVEQTFEKESLEIDFYRRYVAYFGEV